MQDQLIWHTLLQIAVPLKLSSSLSTLLGPWVYLEPSNSEEEVPAKVAREVSSPLPREWKVPGWYDF